MRTVLQLNPPIWLYTPRGAGLAFFLIRESIDHDLEWVCAMQDTAECWTWSNQDIRFQENYTLGRAKKTHVPEHQSPDSSLLQHFVPGGVVKVDSYKLNGKD